MPDAITTKPRVRWQRRVPQVVTVAYVGGLAVWATAGRETGAFSSAIAAVSFAVFASRWTGVVGAVSWGLAIVVASLGAPAANATLDAFAAMGTFSCTAAACVALARLPGDGGVAPTRRVSATVPVAILVAACCLTLGPSIYPAASLAAWLAKHSAVRNGIAVVSSACALAGMTEWTRRARRLELEVVERALAARSLEVVAFSFALLLALVAPSDARSILRLGLALASASVVAACVTSDAVIVARHARRATALAIAGGGVAALGAIAAEGSSTGWATAVTAAVALAIGSNAAFVEKPLRPAGGAWLDAFARAREEAARAEPDDAIRAVLLALRAPNGPGQPSPELWTLTPPTQITVDAAGYIREQSAELPGDLLAVVTAEPEGALRSEVLDALEVRRPDLRPLCGWMAARGALLAGRVGSQGEPEGILVLPRGLRQERMTLEELRAMRSTCDCLAIACRARAASARMRATVRDAAERVETAETRANLCIAQQAVTAARGSLAEQRLARGADVGIYSAVARMAVEALERRLASGRPVVVVGPSGLDPIPFVARAHLRTGGSSGVLVVVDATDPGEQELARWLDARSSPLALAVGGILAILDIAAMPDDVNAAILQACTEYRAPWDGSGRLDVQLVGTIVRRPGDPAVEETYLSGGVRDAFGEPVVLPPLSERPDDLRSILIGGLAREGLRVVGRPLGIEPSAYARLAEYEFPGDVAELSVVVQRLVASCRGDMIRVADVELIGLGGPPRQSGPSAASGGRVRKDPISA
jgi:hypothetical protein